MKIRNGFVTNSSSSSFIIGRAGDEKLTLDDVFDIIKGIYQEWLQKSKDVVAYYKSRVELNPNYPVRFTEYAVEIAPKVSREVRDEVNREIEDMFDMSFYELYEGQDVSFLECQNYEEFRKWACDRIDSINTKNGKYSAVKFGIDYLSNPHPVVYYDGNTDSEKDNHDWEYKEVMEWYCPQYEYIDENNGECNCATCSERKYCGGEVAMKEIMAHKDLPASQRLGQICIYSQCGNLPEYVVRRLADYAHLYCNHMG